MDLDGIRQEIDELDSQLRELFLRRMDLSGKVIESKKKTGAAVYAPEREQAVIAARTNGVSEEYLLECRAFFGQLMGISKTYQYSKLAGGAKRLRKLPDGAGEVEVCFLCDGKSENLAACLNAAAIAGLSAKHVSAKEQGERCICQICLTGDFSTERARAAVLQMLEENEDAKIVSEQED